MNLAKAINLMVAARDDAILAAWVYMITDQAVHAVTDLSPYDAWDAYQRLYDLGLVEATAFHREQRVPHRDARARRPGPHAH